MSYTAFIVIFFSIIIVYAAGMTAGYFIFGGTKTPTGVTKPTPRHKKSRPRRRR